MGQAHRRADQAAEAEWPTRREVKAAAESARRVIWLVKKWMPMGGRGIGRPAPGCARPWRWNASPRPRLRSWFKEFDTNDNGELERDELSALLLYLHPEHPPDDALLDMLIEKATAVESFSISLRGSKDGAVSRMAAQKTVQTYDAYIRQKKKLDEIFTTHDADNVRHPPPPCAGGMGSAGRPGTASSAGRAGSAGGADGAGGAGGALLVLPHRARAAPGSAAPHRAPSRPPAVAVG